MKVWAALVAAVTLIAGGAKLKAQAAPAAPKPFVAAQGDQAAGTFSLKQSRLETAAHAVKLEGPKPAASVAAYDAAKSVLLGPDAADGSAAQTSAPPVITLQDALKLARANSVEFNNALAQAGIAHEDKVQARAGLLPSVTYNNQFLYTEGNGTAAGRFIAANGVHEYLSEGSAHEALGLGTVADWRRAGALEAAARARAEIARRGLVVTVVQNYYGLTAAERKYATAQSAAGEAQRFLTISQELQRGGEVAQADVIKAQLQLNDRNRDLREAQLAMERARIALAALLFRDFNLNFTVVDDQTAPAPLPTFQEVQAKAKENNPELAAALKALSAARAEVTSARGGYLPTLALDYFYGVDANQLAVQGEDPRTGQRFKNLGYSATATVSIPVWNWGATHSKVKQSLLREGVARLQLSAAQKKLLGDLQSLYSEADVARTELETLRQSSQLAAQSLKLTNLRYQAGEATALEVVDAQNAYALAQNNYDDGEVRYQTALASLQTLTGTMY